MHPCEQRDNIVNISHTLERMEKGQEQVVELLKMVVNQDGRITSLEEQSERCYNKQNVLCDRLGECEKMLASNGPSIKLQIQEVVIQINETLDKLNRFFEIITSKPALSIYGVILVMVATGTILDFNYHTETLKAIYHFFRG